MNHAPTVDEPALTGEPIPLIVNRNDFRVWVVARDEDDDALSFTWITPDPFPEVTTTSNDQSYTSVLTIQPEDVSSGQSIRCIISDGNFDEDVEVRWLVDLP